MKALVSGCLVALLLLVSTAPSPTSADTVSWDVIAAGGVVGSASAGFVLSATVGQTGVGLLTGTTYHIYSGFWNPWLISLVEAQDPHGINLPTSYHLSHNYPNPFGPTTVIPYALPKPSHVSLEIFNLRGQQVRLLTDATQQPGYHFACWDGKDSFGREVGSGIYLCRMRAGTSAGTVFERSRELLLVR
jgi:hypothetical protein